MENPVFVIIAIAVLVLCVIAGVRWNHECEAHGGHVKTLYKSSVCLSDDGRIIEW